MTDAHQRDLVITPADASTVTVDNIEVGQFIYLLLNSPKIREVLDTLTAKVVLILGRFTPQRKVVLDAIRDALRSSNYSPVVFDFQKPATRDLTETISTLAHMARFVIADLTEASSVPQELSRIVPGLPSVPVAPILQRDFAQYSMFEHFARYPWVLPVQHYADVTELISSLRERVLAPAEAQLASPRGA